ncbi:DNA polymerase III subunit epsilon [Orientia tsutsugamushi]|uniref:DNA polymerase III subunit epsilon n=1 Tax=Orientia tsutsugamushi TaxID=784 RepID=A0A2U3RAW4_ORITS|nr:DNA polymerase III subunit epsilon [Orientia tsutsugamushi]KJV75659.1 DNA polymerase III, epsilon subunit [Orientia tsutsugamushi str. TA763]SPP23951.1 DNA polymerase III subunit epsilon [Orientia tsutsugamushi]SPR10341.1 DNA polymerase III subunit epsilon [Orientia tsutsugamushi]
MQRKIVLDTETSGLDHKQGHRIIEIGAVELDSDCTEIRNTFHYYINPERDISKEAYKVHGLSRDFLSDKPKFREIVDEFLQFIDGAQLIMHNANFDMQFLNSELFRIRKSAIPNTCVIDTLTLARKRFPKERVNLDALCYKFRIDTSDRILHGALKDAQLLALVYGRMMRGMQVVLLDDTKHNKEIIISNCATNINNTVVVEPTCDEIIQHQQLLSKIHKHL